MRWDSRAEGSGTRSSIATSYDNWVNPIAAGNGSGVNADGPPLHGLPCSANVVIPANGFVVFAPMAGIDSHSGAWHSHAGLGGMAR